jgi:hypothetical protein
MGTVRKPVDPSKFIEGWDSLERFSSGTKNAVWLRSIFRKEESSSRNSGERLFDDAPENVANWLRSLHARAC